MPRLFSSSSNEQADLYALILSSAAIPYTLVKSDQLWEIWVQPADIKDAEEKIEAYFLENPEAMLPTPAETAPHASQFAGFWGASLLILFHAAISYHHASENMIRRFGANADRIMHGEIYRAVTALMIHSGTLHLIANFAGLLVFGTAVCSITGTGMGWLLILLSGTAGNLANAAFYQSAHVSVGASTAVLGAVGILSAIALLRNRKPPHSGARAWLPLAAGLGLLAILGSGGEHTDLMAHFFGFITGLAIGFGHAVFLAFPLSKNTQAGCGVLTLAILFAAWFF